MEEYFAALEDGVKKAYAVAQEARKKGIDPETRPEIPLAKGLAERVESLVGPPGVAGRIKELSLDQAKEEVAVAVAKEIVEGRFGSFATHEAAAEQALRTSLAILTEGVVAAPLEGIVKVKVKKNSDGTRYLAIYFAGPIRSAGGTAQALAVLTGDYVRRALGMDRYKPTPDEVERFAEETELYNSEAARLQYHPPAEDIRTAVKNIPVEVTGEATDQVEVSGYRDLERVETNQLRGGAVLVLAEGVLQKAPKVLKYVTMLGLDGWEWLSAFATAKKEGEESSQEVKPNYKFIKDIIAGRPILAYPSRPGGLRLRYGRARNSGFASTSLHPATMILLDGFIVTGTQIKTERPGKASAVTPCDAIEGPLVKLVDGSVVRVENLEEAERIKGSVKEILALGDILVNYGDFLENNHVLMPSGYVEEWWAQEVRAALEGRSGMTIPDRPSPEEALAISDALGVPLHPRYTYLYNLVPKEDLRRLVEWLSKGTIEERALAIQKAEEKEILETLGVPHRVAGNRIQVGEYKPLLRSLGMDEGLSPERFLAAYDRCTSSMELVNSFGLKVRDKARTYIGARMGRPEKARERRMQPAVNVLFPVGQAGGRTRDVKKAAAKKGKVEVEVARRECASCKEVTYKTLCPRCGRETKLKRVCTSGHPSEEESCRACGSPANYFEKRELDVREALEGAIYAVGDTPKDLKGVIGMTSAPKIPEALEKGILRSKHEVYVFKDGTARFDATDVPLTHFKPGEIGVAVERLRALGYDRDYKGVPLTSEDQVVELKCQDILLPTEGAGYLLRVSKFVDELLAKVYGQEPYYRAEKREDLLGHLVLGLAPHTSAAILGRIVGFTGASVGYAHPYFHAAKRRNCDGDEDSIFLLMDALLNFSRAYLPSSRGGKMDAPLVLTIRLDPREVDDEAHNMDIVEEYPLAFYEATLRYAKPQEVAGLIETIGERIGKPEQYYGFRFTHSTTDIAMGPTISAYKTLGAMTEKVQHQLDLAAKIRAVDERDVAKRVIEGHLLPDLAGNLRTFSKQKIRCVDCNAKYRRVPLTGKCRRCNGKLVLTVSRGAVAKYLEVTKGMIERYRLDDYLKQRIRILEMSISSVFENDGAKQVSLADFLG
ncbi:MAG: DNA polymerase II large subunit [Candidatus Hydrothermarchaeota archaeon]